MSIFTKNKKHKLPRSRFNLSHSNILTLKPGRLVPVNIEELAPGDKIGFRTSYSLLTDALFAPVMQDMRFCIRDFFVPHRLLMKDFEDYIAMNYKEDSNLKQRVLAQPYEPYTTIGDILRYAATQGPTFSYGKVMDYLRYDMQGLKYSDIQDKAIADKKLTIMPVLAYLKVFLDWFNDENFLFKGKETWDNLMDAIATNNYEVSYNTTFSCINYDGTSTTKYVLEFLFTDWYVMQPKNYFTSALPEQQKGPAVKVPFSSNDATVLFRTNGPNDYIPNTASRMQPYTISANDTETEEFAVISPPTDTTVTVMGKLFADLSSVESPSIIEFRTREALQKFLERNNVGGTRYTEFLRAHYGVKLPDPFAQRSEYLHGMKFPLSADPVFAHADGSVGDQTSLIGDYAGKLMSKNQSSYAGKFCKEHGFHIMVAYIQIPSTMGIFGLPRVNERVTADQYMIPEFSYIGEQPIHSTELSWGINSDPDKIFGYTPRFADFKCHLNEVHGDFKNTLDYWHAGLLSDTSDVDFVNGLNVLIAPIQFSSRMFSSSLLDPFRIWIYFDYRKTSCMSK